MKNPNQAKCCRCELTFLPSFFYRHQAKQYCGRYLATQTTAADLTMKECQINVSFPPRKQLGKGIFK